MTTGEMLSYAVHVDRRGAVPLSALFFRAEGTAPAPLVVWMHSGGFRTGRIDHPNHPRIAEEFARRGYASAFVQYRLARPPAILQPLTEARLAALVADARAAREEMTESFWQERPLAVVEDCCAFLNYAEAQRAELGLSGDYVLAGSSAGAISALNTLYLPRYLGLIRPHVRTVIAFSGAFAYPSFVWQTGARILAVHSPGDGQVPISSIRRLAEVVEDEMILIDCDVQTHGDLRLEPGESMATAVERCIRFDTVGDLDTFTP